MKMKKIILTSFVLLLSISLVACNKNEKINNDENISLDETLDNEELDKSFRSSNAGSDEWFIEHLKEFTYYTAVHESSNYTWFMNKFSNTEKNYEKGKENANELIKICEETGFQYKQFYKSWRRVSKEDFEMSLIFAYAYNDGDFRGMRIEEFMEKYNAAEEKFRSNTQYKFIVQGYTNTLEKEIEDIKKQYQALIEQAEDEKTKQELLDEQEEMIANKTEEIEGIIESELDTLRNKSQFNKSYPDIKDYIDRDFISMMEQTFDYFNIHH
ncbi:MAG: hypothetical protein MJ245_04810 [Clostridia bacterium]|nr:hypothetical protein [Clostridia bacterium]